MMTCISMHSCAQWKHHARGFLSLRALLLPSLVLYGILVEPSTGQGGIPCIWKLCFGLECPGCGLSRADAFLMRGDLQAAMTLNWLILPLWLVSISSFAFQVSALIRKGGVPWLNWVL